MPPDQAAPVSRLIVSATTRSRIAASCLRLDAAMLAASPCGRTKRRRHLRSWLSESDGGQTVPSLRQAVPVQRYVLQEDDRLGVDDFAALDHGERLRQRQLDHLDVLAL